MTAGPPAEMRAAGYDRYGGPEVVRVERVPVPEPAAGQVLVRVEATGVNLSDWECLVGRPAYARIGGLRRPARRVLGSDIAGTVVAIGDEVPEFAVGDEIYADNLGLKGGFAEYALVPVHAMTHRPEGLDSVRAAAIPQPAAIAVQGTRSFDEGDRVLINGAGGGSGSFAVQLAKLAGAHVTAVDNAGKLDHLRSLGADEVIDYRVTDPMRTDEGYDHILDMVAHRWPLRYRKALVRGGRYRCVGGGVPTMLGVVSFGALAAKLTGRSLGMLAVREGPDHFGELGQRVADGEIDVHVERTCGLGDTAEALRLVGDGAARGKLVVVPT